MEPRIEEKGPFTFVGLEITTTVADNQIPELWEEFIDRMDDIADVDDVHNTFGICQYVDAESMTEDTPFNYMAAMAAAGAEDLPEGMTVRNLPKRLYAIFTHRGSLETWTSPTSSSTASGSPPATTSWPRTKSWRSMARSSTPTSRTPPSKSGYP